MDLIGRLAQNEDARGIIGQRARGSLVRLPSSVYWSALTRWGIFQPQQSQGWYQSRFDALVDGRGVVGRADDPGVIWSQQPHWHPRLPEPPARFPWEAPFALTPDEADFLRGRVEERCAGTLLAWLVRNGTDSPAADFWDDPDARRAPDGVRETLELARRFSLHVEGIPLLYNLAVAERRREVLDSDEDESIDEFRAALAEWARQEAAGGGGAPVRAGCALGAGRPARRAPSVSATPLHRELVAPDRRSGARQGSRRRSVADVDHRTRAASEGRTGEVGQPESPAGLEPGCRRRPDGLPLVSRPATPDRPAPGIGRLMLPPDSRATAFELIRPPSGYRLDFAVLTTYTLDLEALLVLPLSVLAHPDGGVEELLADPLRLHQAIRDAGDRVHAFVDQKGIAIPRGARSLYSMLESSVHPMRASNGGAFHPKVWVARFTAEEAAEDLLRVAVLSRNLTFDRSWDVALASEAPFRSRRYVAASRPLRDFLLELPRLATDGNRIPQDVAERVEGLADQVWRTAFPAPEGFDSPIEFHSIGLARGRRTWRPPSSGHSTLAVAPFVNRAGLDAVGRLGRDGRILVSRQEELDKLSEDALAAWKQTLVLSDAAQGEAEDGPSDADEDGQAGAAGTDKGDPGTGTDTRPSGLHATR